MTKTREDTLTRLASLLGLAKVHGLDTFALTVEDLAALEQFAPPKLQTMELRVDASSLVGRLSGTEGIVLDIFAERDRQDAQWGGPDHDDSHSARDWLVYVNKQVETAIGETLSDDTTQLVDPEHYRQRMVKIAALAVAAIESLDRAIPRPLPGEPEPEERQATFQPYEDAAGEFRWRFVALNGQIMADSGEGYATPYNVYRAIDTFRELVADATVEQL